MISFYSQSRFHSSEVDLVRDSFDREEDLEALPHEQGHEDTGL